MHQHDVPDDVLVRSAAGGVARAIRHLSQAQGQQLPGVPHEPDVAKELPEAIASLEDLARILKKEFREP